MRGRRGGERSATEIFKITPEIAEYQQRFSRLISHRVPWAVRHDLLAANPMDKIDAVKVRSRCLARPRPAPAGDIGRMLGAICSRRPRKDVPLDRLRDRVLFETAYVCGARASEVCGLYVEDLDLRLDDEHVRIHGKSGTVRTVPLDDRGYVALLRLYLARSGYTAGPLFRARPGAEWLGRVWRVLATRRGGLLTGWPEW